MVYFDASRRYRILAGRAVYEDLAAIDQLVFAPVCTVAEVRLAAQCIYRCSRSLRLVVGPSLISSLLGDPVFRMWHDALFYLFI